MSWWSIEVGAPAGRKDEVGAWLVARTGQAVEERDDLILLAYVPDEQLAAQVVISVGLETDGWVERGPREVEPPDWSTEWRAGLGVRRIGRVSVVPSWLPEATNPGPHDVILDPETAFGTGEHGSTRVALTLMEHLLRPLDRVLDLGSGSGVLTIAAAKLGAARAIGIELDPDAIGVAERNAERNQVSGRVEFLDGEAEDLVTLLGPADLVVSNILRAVNTRLLSPISAALTDGGTAIFAGMEVAEADAFRRTLADAGFRVIEETVDAGWWGAAARRAE